jgi:glycosyltransferase involved in cell wall biosynthesis
LAAYVDLSGTGIGARKQYDLLRKTRPHLFTSSEGNADTIIYWQSFTRDWERLKRRRAAKKKIVCRVGGFHPENELTTWQLLKVADGAIFVAQWHMDYLKTCQRVAGELKTWRLPPKRRVIRNGSEWVGWRDSETDYLLIRCAQIGDVRFKRGLNRAYSVWAMAQVWNEIRIRYPRLELWILGQYNREIKKEYALPGWKWLGYKANSQWYGQGAVALVHLVTGDYSPNSVAEAVGEGCPVLVPNIGGALELAGEAGRAVRFGQTDRRQFPEAEFAGHFFEVDKKDLLQAVSDVMDNQMRWRWAVGEQWRKEVNIQRVADRYENFLDSI